MLLVPYCTDTGSWYIASSIVSDEDFCVQNGKPPTPTYPISSTYYHYFHTLLIPSNAHRLIETNFVTTTVFNRGLTFLYTIHFFMPPPYVYKDRLQISLRLQILGKWPHIYVTIFYHTPFF